MPKSVSFGFFGLLWVTRIMGNTQLGRRSRASAGKRKAGTQSANTYFRRRTLTNIVVGQFNYPGDTHESSTAEGFYPYRIDDRGCDHRYSGRHRSAGLPRLHGSFANDRSHDFG